MAKNVSKTGTATQLPNKVYKKVNGVWKELGDEPETLKLKTYNEYALSDLELKSLAELKELIRRQEKILANK